MFGNGYLDAGPFKVARAVEVRSYRQMNFGKVASKPQGLIERRVGESASLWRRIDIIKIEAIVSLREYAIGERELAVLLNRLFE